MKSERFEIKLEDNQLDRKCSIDEMMASKSLLHFVASFNRLQGNYDALERRKEELKQKLVEKMEVCHFKLARYILEIPLNFISFSFKKKRLMNCYGDWMIELEGTKISSVMFFYSAGQLYIISNASARI